MSASDKKRERQGHFEREAKIMAAPVVFIVVAALLLGLLGFLLPWWH